MHTLSFVAFAPVSLVLASLLPATPPPTASPAWNAAQTAKAQASPFEMVRWDGENPQVQVGGAWWGLEGIGDLSCERILDFARREYGERWAKRFCEDLPEMLTKLGRPPGSSVTLRLRDLTSDEVRTLENVAMSEANRRKIREAAPRPAGLDERDSAPRPTPVTRVTRERSGVVTPPFQPLVQRFESLEVRAPRLSRAQAQADLEQLEWLIANVFSYRDRTQVDWRAAFDTLHAGLGESISLASFQLQLHGLLTLFGDGHSRLQTSTSELLLPGVLPVRCVRDAHGVVALDSAGALLDPQRPYLRTIDGESLETWLALAATLGARGSPAFEDRTALRRVVHLGHLRAVRGANAAPSAKLGLAKAAEPPRELEVQLGGRELRAPRPVRLEARRLPGEIGYLRIGSMDDDEPFLAELERHLAELTGVRGLVIDVRGNGGGSRDVLLRIAPRIFPKGVASRVVNVAALRIAPGDDPRTSSAALADRFLYPREWPNWSSTAKNAVEEHAARFKASWTPVAGEFGPWCYLVLERQKEVQPLTTGPVAVLLDGECFSATDVFVGALREFDNVTLVGAPSGGGSGRARGHVLEHSRVELQLSTMISYLPSGELYDGAGVQPDVLVRPTLDDVLGRSDTALERAAAIARKR